ncbi:LysR family transcriptional regulator [Thalassobacillus sp. CUG 92003]|uniref:LysR family transcriptional regulator n=1 Tax=Thalassobacillus sp. CUG 92003 TaxID=2736641 RepID=UPI0015E6ABD5|nr:LysR family transcriptional regulator [Thalassobacillus sp. CUG 92003]
MELKLLHYFIEVTKEKSFSVAAEKLYISQPALSKQIKKLESMIGFALLTRSSQGIELTSKGQELYHGIQPHLVQIQRKLENLKDNVDIRFGATPFLATYYLPQYYEALASENFRITAIKDNGEELTELLERQEIDAAIVQDLPSYPGLFSRFLFDDHFYAAVPTHHPLAQKMVVSIDECLSETQIIPPSPSPLKNRIQSLMNQNNIKPEHIIETPYHAIIGCVAMNMGVSYFPSIAVKYMQYHGVTFLPLKDAPLKRSMYLYAVAPDILDQLTNKLSNA